MTKSKGIRKRRPDRERLRDLLMSPQTEDEIRFADEHIASEARRIKDEFYESIPATKGESDE